MGSKWLARGRQAWTTAIGAVWLGRGKQTMARSTGDAELLTPRLPPPRLGERITVLSIDGGGIRGLIPSVVLASLEQELQNLDGKNARIADYFDVIAVTSTGALIAAMLVTPVKGTNRPRSAEEIKNLYLEIGPKIFPPMSPARKLARMLRGPIYDHKFLHEKIRDITSDLRLDQTLTKILVPAFDVRRLFPRILSSYKPHGEERAHDRKPKLSDVCIGSSAAPTLFKAHHFDGLRDGGGGHGTAWAKFHLIDGGVSANNPTMSAYVDFTKFNVISIGTGTFKEAETEMYTAEECAKWGGIHWIYDWWRNRHPIVDVLTHSSDFLVDRDVSMLLYSLGCDKNYLRIQAMVDPSENILSMDDATKENMDELIKIGRDLLREPVTRVSKITAMHEDTHETDANGRPVTNRTELKDYAEILSKERKLRLEKKEEEDARQAAKGKEA
ncbi:unnamed protein product [Urochloa decumbens]|uniref:Patatin n=1 Tax=Urochloa decumbens TaxID=240449 RepID=A0ABC9B606_9POAL